MADEVREADHEGDHGARADAPVDDDVAAALCAKFEGAVYAASHGQPVVYLPREQMAAAALILRDEHEFTMCIDTCVVDHLADGVRHCPEGVQPQRFEVVANFLSHTQNRRMRLIAQVPVADPSLPSLVGVFPGANFAERESYDLFGITFDGHPELVRILMPDDWDGHPLRKDYAPARVPVTFKGDPSPR